MNAETLKSRLLEMDAESSRNWMEPLEARKRKELEFHDRYRDLPSMESLDQDTFDKIYGNKKYYIATELSKNHVDAWIREHAKGKIFLDYACGNGGNAIKAAKAGAALSVGIDISPVSVANARRDAGKEGVEGNTVFLRADAENTGLPDNSIDRVICSGMLHHLDLTYAFPELRRILAPGGKILVVEALNYNPAIKLYRHLTPDMRTEWEKNHILSLKDVEFARRFFTVGEVHYWHILSILAPYMKPFLRFFNAADKVLTRIPLVRLMAWIFTFELGKESG
ncbi:MAG: hypothetical protein A2Z40_00945 [Deltaproteobacteria bacterium RBG_19FT_COMBO_60_16]|nr:MAG: hypothetical protein A2Z13_02880 [Deltaproteobacteria bacterium RBG_16_64_85]OGQ00545.1 MAG: hypothetical protein A2Z40_00945 [Deltaproteobacteria bacterium RBG_19FT_COMBO_60_16]